MKERNAEFRFRHSEDVKMEAELGVMLPQAKEHQGLSAASRSKKR
jgi:hypothetical protein